MRLDRIKKYIIFARSGIQMAIAYRGLVFLWLLGSVINAAIMCLLWWAIYEFSPTPVIGGFVFPQMLLYVMLISMVAEISYSNTMESITEDVHYGFIGIRLTKPVDYRAQLGFTAIGTFIGKLFIVGIPLALVSTLVAVFGFGLSGIVWYNVLLFLPACVMSLLLTDAFQFLFGQLAFRTHAMFGVHTMMSVIMRFLSGAIVPLALFPVWAQSVLAFTPFPSLISFPVRLYLGVLAWSDVLIGFGSALIWAVALNVIGRLLYKASVRSVVVFGG